LRKIAGKCIVVYIQQDATLHILFYVENALHVSGGTTTHHPPWRPLPTAHSNQFQLIHDSGR